MSPQEEARMKQLAEKAELDNWYKDYQNTIKQTLKDEPKQQALLYSQLTPRQRQYLSGVDKSAHDKLKKAYNKADKTDLAQYAANQASATINSPNATKEQQSAINKVSQSTFNEAAKTNPSITDRTTSTLAGQVQGNDARVAANEGRALTQAQKEQAAADSSLRTDLNERGADTTLPDNQVNAINKAAVGSELTPNTPSQPETAEATEPETESETEEVAEQASKAVAEGDKPSNKFWNAWKSGAFDMYPTMKAVADAIAKNARMTMDRAALLTGGQRDPEAYNAIETETDKIRDIQRAERAENITGETNQEVIKSAMDAPEGSDQEAQAFKALGTAIANGNIDYDNAVKGMSASKKERFDKAIGRFETTEDLNVEQKKAEVKQNLINNKATIQQNIRAIDEQITNLNEMKRQLAGNDTDAYARAANAFLGVRKGIESIGSANTSQSSTGGGANLTIPVVNIGGNFSGSEGTAASSTLSRDTLALAGLPTADQWGKLSMEEQNAANNKMIEEIDKQIQELQDLKDEWKFEYRTSTGERL